MTLTSFFNVHHRRLSSLRDGVGPDEATDFAERVLSRVEHLPPDPSHSAFVPDDATCTVRSIGSHWGVYGAGVTALPVFDGLAFRSQLLLDPAWLDRDLRRNDAGVPWMIAAEAEWATGMLQRVLDLEIPAFAVLRASLPPAPYGISSGMVSEWPSAAVRSPRSVIPGRIGPPVTYVDGRSVQHEGFLTAAHVAPPDPALTDVDVADWAAARTVGILRTGTMPALGTGFASVLTGDVDAAIVDSGGDPLVGIGPHGSAAALDDVERITPGSPQTGTVVGYTRWMATDRTGWSDCYMIATDTGSFAEPGHSGAAVVSNGSVIGIVVGGARSVAGCSTALTYVQDIDTITSALQCTVVDP